MKSPDSPVNGYTALHTRDLDDAERTLSRCYLPLLLRGPRSFAPFSTALSSLDLGGTTVGRLRFGTEIGIRTAEAKNFHIDIPLSGRSVSRAGTAQQVVTAPGTAQVFMPGERADLNWAANTQELCVMAERHALEGHLAMLLNADVSRPLVFRTVMDLRSPGATSWMHVLKLVNQEFQSNDGLLQHRIIRATLERLIIESLLLGHDHNYSAQLHQAQALPGRTPIRAALELLETHPERPWTAGTLAADVGLSVRALHDGFRRTTDSGPMTYLRRIRLAHVHEDLAQADPSTTSVARVARRWGFAHLGRFSAAYAKRYGEPPSTTLRRAFPR